MKLTVENRAITGHKVKYLRKQAKIPAVVYGRHLDEQLIISVPKVAFVNLYTKAGKSTPIQISGDGVDQLVLIQDIQLDPISDHVTHVDFLAVNKDEKVHAEVPLILVGDSPFVKSSLGRIQQLKETVEVEALPLDLPHDIKIDISSLDHAGQVVFIKDLEVSTNVVILDDSEQAVVSTIEFSNDSEDDDETTSEEQTEENPSEEG